MDLNALGTVYSVKIEDLPDDKKSAGIETEGFCNKFSREIVVYCKSVLDFVVLVEVLLLSDCLLITVVGLGQRCSIRRTEQNCCEYNIRSHKVAVSLRDASAINVNINCATSI